MNKKPKRSRKRIRRTSSKTVAKISKRDFGRSLSLYATVFFFLTLSLLPWLKSEVNSLTAIDLFMIPLIPIIKIGLWVSTLLGVLNIIVVQVDRKKDLKIILIATSLITGLVVSISSACFFIMVLPQIGSLLCFISGLGLIYSSSYLLKSKWKPSVEVKKEKNIPWIIIGLIVFNSIVLILVNYIFKDDQAKIIKELSLISGSPRWYTLFTSIFLHIDFFHYISNMIVLWWVGSILYQKVSPFFLLCVYFITGIFGSLSCLLIDPRIYSPILGASGAIAGLIGLGCVLAPNVICQIPYYTFLWYGRVSVRAIWIFAFWIMTQSLAAFNLSIGVVENVAYWAHIGGIFSGLACGLIYLKVFPKNKVEDVVKVDNNVTEKNELKLSKRREVVNRKNSKTYFPQYLIVTSLMITFFSVYLTYSSFTITGRVANFQLAWNKGSLDEVVSFFQKESRERMKPKLAKKIIDLEERLGLDELSTNSNLINVKISFNRATYYEHLCKAEFYVAPIGVDPYREQNKCGRLSFNFYKINHVWVVKSFSFSIANISKIISSKKKNVKNSKTERKNETMSTIEKIDGFDVVNLKNDYCSVKVVPELGMKIISLKNIKSNREWLWSPDGTMKLFSNDSSDPFGKSTLVGADECFPTMDDCEIKGVKMGDHGLIWANKCEYEINDHTLTCSIKIEQINMIFKRIITLSGPKILFQYELENLSSDPHPYIWTFHPLIDIKENDLWSYKGVWGNFLCTAVKNVKNLSKGSNVKIDDLKGFFEMNLTEGEKDNHFINGFYTNDSQTMFEIKNSETQDSLRFDYTNIPFTSIWLTRGGWRGHHHIAIEPSNSCYEKVNKIGSDAEEMTTLQPDETRKWEFSITLLGE